MQSPAEEATRRRPTRVAEVRRTGPSGNYWYAVELERNLKPAQVREVRFWGESIALYRDEHGQLHALENRCAHRQLALSEGRVQGCRLVCQYHGWKYDGSGRCVEVSHELGPREMLPKIRLRSYPVKVQYGLIWLFPGDPELAQQVPLPHVPQLCGSNPWPVEPIDVTIDAHFSMIVENVCDFNHAYLHRRKQPFTNPKLRHFAREGDTVRVFYDTSFAHSRIARLSAENQGRNLDSIELWYQYPYQGSNIANKYLHWLFMLPEGPGRTRCFFLFLFGPIELPLLRRPLPEFFKPAVLKLANLLYINPLLGEDKWALEQEQAGFERHPDKPMIELNPIVRSFQDLTREKWLEWQEHRTRQLLRPRGTNTASTNTAQAPVDAAE